MKSKFSPKKTNKPQDKTYQNQSAQQIKNGFDILPANESQCRSLSKFTGSELVWKWRAIMENIDAHKITAQAIAEFLSDEEKVVEPEEESCISILGAFEHAGITKN